MAKRFTDTDKWKKPFIKGLQGPYKLLWFYILDDCNHAGIWEVDIEVANIRIGEQVNEAKALELFSGRVIKISENKWFIPDFISFQYGELSEKNRLHISVIAILRKYNIDFIKPLISPLEGAKDKDKDKDKVKDKDKEQDKDIKGGTGGKYIVPEMFKVFKSANPDFPGSVEHDYKPLWKIATFLCEQANVGPPENYQSEIIEAWSSISQWVKKDSFYSQKSLSTISNHIQEITQKAVHGDKSTKKKNGSGIDLDTLKQKAAERVKSWG